jgi:hypothetical protein
VRHWAGLVVEGQCGWRRRCVFDVTNTISESIEVGVERTVEQPVVAAFTVVASVASVASRTIGLGIIAMLAAWIGGITEQGSVVVVPVVHLCTPFIGWYPLQVPALRSHLE